MKTKLLPIIWVAALALLMTAPPVRSLQAGEGGQVAAVRWTPDDPKPGLTG